MRSCSGNEATDNYKTFIFISQCVFSHSITFSVFCFCWNLLFSPLFSHFGMIADIAVMSLLTLLLVCGGLQTGLCETWCSLLQPWPHNMWEVQAIPCNSTTLTNQTESTWQGRESLPVSHLRTWLVVWTTKLKLWGIKLWVSAVVGENLTPNNWNFLTHYPSIGHFIKIWLVVRYYISDRHTGEKDSVLCKFVPFVFHICQQHEEIQNCC